MNIQIRETGERKTLAILDRKSGVDWVNDLIGNAGAFDGRQFVWDEDADAYLTDQDTYDWWAQYIAGTELTEEEAASLADEFGLDVEDIRLEISDALGTADYEDHRNIARRVLDEIRGKQQ